MSAWLIALMALLGLVCAFGLIFTTAALRAVRKGTEDRDSRS